MKYLHFTFFLTLLMTLLVGAGIIAPVNAADSTTWNNEDTAFSGKKAVIEGYDPVAYFTKGKPVQGNPEISYEYQGGTFFFSSPEHKELFVKNPAAYAPQYGGYCAYGVTQKALAPIEPTAWTIEDGKLYLNYNESIQKRWEKDKSGYITDANEKWPKL